MAKREALVMSKNWQESRSSDLARNKQEWSQSSTRAALGLLKEIARDWRGRWGEGCFTFGHGLARHSLCPGQPEFGAFALAEGLRVRGDSRPVRSWRVAESSPMGCCCNNPAVLGHSSLQKYTRISA